MTEKNIGPNYVDLLGSVSYAKNDLERGNLMFCVLNWLLLIFYFCNFKPNNNVFDQFSKNSSVDRQFSLHDLLLSSQVAILFVTRSKNIFLLSLKTRQFFTMQSYIGILMTQIKTG